MIVASLLFIAFIAAYAVLAKILYRYRRRLASEHNKKTFGTVYKGRNIDRRRRNYIWIYPLKFLLRRMLFIIITVFFFEKPAI